MKNICDKYYDLAKKNFSKIYRSITGIGNYILLKQIKLIHPELKVLYFKSGTKVFDWKIPKEWNIHEAFILDKNGNKVIDFKNNFLHVVGYSKSINKNVTKKDLLKKIFTLKKIPNAIPYVTAYYKKNFYGFCASYYQLAKIKKNYTNQDKFKLYINSRFKNNGKLHYGEIVLKGKSKREILISTYFCHPLMANNEHSGPIVSMALINYFKKIKLNYTLRFLFIPETIGSIAYIYKNLELIKNNTMCGFNLSCIGDEGGHSYMLSKFENSLSDKALLAAYKKLKISAKKYSFLKRGSDERQYSSPGVNLPVTSIFKTKYGEYKEYHTSLDDFNLVTKKGIYSGFRVAKEAINILNNYIIPKNLIICEPNMGKRGLYPLISTKKKSITKWYMDYLMYADGTRNIEDIAKVININISTAKKINNFLKKKKLIIN